MKKILLVTLIALSAWTDLNCQVSDSTKKDTVKIIDTPKIDIHLGIVDLIYAYAGIRTLISQSISIESDAYVSILLPPFISAGVNYHYENTRDATFKFELFYMFKNNLSNQSSMGFGVEWAYIPMTSKGENLNASIGLLLGVPFFPVVRLGWSYTF